MCGVAVFQWSGNIMSFMSLELPPVAAARYAQRLIDEISGWVVAAERFTPDRRTMSFQPEALEAIGMMRFITETSIRMNHKFVLQGRAEAKKMATTSELKRLGWHKQTKDGHANDAALHVLLALLTHYPQDYVTLMDELQSL